jgi:hypothetical protein
MDAKAIKCQKCGDIIPSKRALRRHLRSRHPLLVNDAESIDDSRRIVVGKVQDVSGILGTLAIGVDNPTVLALDQIPDNSQVSDIAVVNEKSSDDSKDVQSREIAGEKLEVTSKTEIGRLAALRRNRDVIDAAVAHLLKAHLRNRTTLSKPTQTLVDELRTKFMKAHLPREVYVGIIVAAKHFAGTEKPKLMVPSTRSIRHHKGALAENAKRKSFTEEIEISVLAATTMSAVVNDLPAPVVENPKSAGKESKSFVVSSEDQEWCRDVWRSYGSREVQLPSPIGCSASPSAVFGELSMPPSTPVRLWSPSSDDFPWGPDSPEEDLEEGNQSLIPDWPLLADDDGCTLDRGGSAFDRRIVEWRTERTSRYVRLHPKKRHHIRSRRASRERYKAQLPEFATIWTNGEGFCRPVHPSDVELPSPPESQSALLQLRRRLLMEKKLPKGCRLQPARGSKRRRVDSTDKVSAVPSKTVNSNIEVPASSVEPELAVPDIDISVFDDNL